MYKTCTICKKQKDISQFYKHSEMKDGHLNQCIECKLIQVKEYREKNAKYIREYDRKRSRTEISRTRRKQYIERLKTTSPKIYKLMRKATTTAYRTKHKEKYLAHCAVSSAIQKGVIKKSDICEICGSMHRIESHHFDYSKPLDIIWLCEKCHKELHIELREKQRKIS